MEMRKPIRLTAMLIAVLMLFSAVALSAEELLTVTSTAAAPAVTVVEDASDKSLIAEVKELMSDVSYVDYVALHADAARPTWTTIFKAGSYSGFSGTEGQAAELRTVSIDGVADARSISALFLAHLNRATSIAVDVGLLSDVYVCSCSSSMTIMPTLSNGAKIAERVPMQTCALPVFIRRQES